jgi:hypothetical protein
MPAAHYQRGSIFAWFPFPEEESTNTKIVPRTAAAFVQDDNKKAPLLSSIDTLLRSQSGQGRGLSVCAAEPELAGLLLRRRW